MERQSKTAMKTFVFFCFFFGLFYFGHGRPLRESALGFMAPFDGLSLSGFRASGGFVVVLFFVLGGGFEEEKKKPTEKLGNNPVRSGRTPMIEGRKRTATRRRRRNHRRTLTLTAGRGEKKKRTVKVRANPVRKPGKTIEKKTQYTPTDPHLVVAIQRGVPYRRLFFFLLKFYFQVSLRNFPFFCFCTSAFVGRPLLFFCVFYFLFFFCFFLLFARP